jgi:hypothetical protein
MIFSINLCSNISFVENNFKKEISYNLFKIQYIHYHYPFQGSKRRRTNFRYNILILCTIMIIRQRTVFYYVLE